MNIGPKLARQVGHPNTSHHDYLANSVQSSTSMFMNLIGPTAIINVICRLKGNKSPGYDDISPKAVKAVTQFISNPLSEVFNISLCVGEFPDKLNLAKVIPIYTSGSAITDWSRCRVESFRRASPYFYETEVKLCEIWPQVSTQVAIVSKHKRHIYNINKETSAIWFGSVNDHGSADDRSLLSQIWCSSAHSPLRACFE